MKTVGLIILAGIWFSAGFASLKPTGDFAVYFIWYGLVYALLVWFSVLIAEYLEKAN